MESENFDDHFETVKFLGEGSFGEVLLVKTKPLFKGLPPGTPVAAKLINLKKLTPLELSMIENEIIVLERLSSYSSTLEDDCYKGIVCYYGNIRLNRNNDKYYIILMEYIEGDLLLDYINEFHTVELDPDTGKPIQVYTLAQYYTDEEIISIMRDLAKTLIFIHSANVVHRDIKVDNIMYDKVKKVFKYIDFGLSCISVINSPETEGIKGKCNIKGLGTVTYVSPEIIRLAYNNVNRPVSTDDDINLLKKSDVWGLGMVFYGFVNGITPFSNEEEAINELFNPDPMNIPDYPGDPRIDRVISKMLTKDYRKRPSAEEVYKMLE